MRTTSIFACTALVACASAYVLPQEFKTNSALAIKADDVAVDAAMPQIYASRQGMMFVRNRPVVS